MTSTGIITRERFVTATLTLLRQGGLPAAGLADVVALARAPKGSLYHYFPQGKSQMVVEALNRYRELVNEQLAVALSSEGNLSQRVARLFQDSRLSTPRSRAAASELT
jgi:TetR/AcrR family transcriptional repressor of lmrAB and yxaGH operons